MAIAAAGTHKLQSLFSMHVEGGAGGSVHNTSPVLVEQGPQPEGGRKQETAGAASPPGAPSAGAASTKKQPAALQPVPLHVETLWNDGAAEEPVDDAVGRHEAPAGAFEPMMAGGGVALDAPPTPPSGPVEGMSAQEAERHLATFHAVRQAGGAGPPLPNPSDRRK
jgi:hypothetical protein